MLNTETLEVEDNIVLLNSNVTGSPTLDAGLEVEREPSLTFYNAAEMIIGTSLTMVLPTTTDGFNGRR